MPVILNREHRSKLKLNLLPPASFPVSHVIGKVRLPIFQVTLKALPGQ